MTVGEVVAALKIMPESPEVDLDRLRSDVEGVLPEGTELQGTDTEDVAFGLTALLATVSLADAEGGTDPVQEAFEGLDGVESVQVTEVSRV